MMKRMKRTLKNLIGQVCTEICHFVVPVVFVGFLL